MVTHLHGLFLSASPGQLVVTAVTAVLVTHEVGQGHAEHHTGQSQLHIEIVLIIRTENIQKWSGQTWTVGTVWTVWTVWTAQCIENISLSDYHCVRSLQEMKISVKTFTACLPTLYATMINDKYELVDLGGNRWLYSVGVCCTL